MKKFDIPDFYRSPVISRIKDYRKNEDPRKKNFIPTMLDFGSVRFFIARHFGLSEVFIGLAIVAVGTTLPELVTSVIATLRGKGDLAVGNIIGSNIYNLYLIIGAAASLAPQTIDVPAQILRFDLLFMFLSFSLWFGIIRKYQVMERKFGLLFLGIYGFYLLLQVSLFQK